MVDRILATDKNFPEVSIVMPCLNEADTLASCIAKPTQALKVHELAGEIIVADNGSTDGSQAIATQLGARLIKRPGGNSRRSGLPDNSFKLFREHFRNPSAMREGGQKTFDAYADDYDVALARELSVSGEQKDYFAHRRIEWLRD